MGINRNRSEVGGGSIRQIGRQNKLRFKGHNAKFGRKVERFSVKTRKLIGRSAIVFARRKHRQEKKYRQLASFGTAIVVILSLAIVSFYPWIQIKPYSLSESSRNLLPRPSDSLAELLNHYPDQAYYLYNDGYSPVKNTINGSAGNGKPRFTATIHSNAERGIVINDPVENVSFTLKPKFRLSEGRKDQNRIVHRLRGGSLVYTAQIAGIKEDIILENYSKDTAEFTYELGLENGLKAKLEHNGALGIYGSSLPINGQVSTGSQADAELLEKARQNAAKDKLIFTIPAPIVKETGKDFSNVAARFELEGNSLKIIANGLKNANYPLTIDPSVYVESAVRLMRGNNESNVDFDFDNELFQKGATTGARIDEWGGTSDMNSAIWDQATASAGGYVYRAGGKSGRIMPRIVGQQETTQSTDSTTFTMNMPSTRPAGDLYVALIAHDGTVTVSPPSGWTEYADIREHAAYYKVGTDAGGGNEAANYQWTGSGSEAWAGVILRITDFDSADIVSGSAATNSSNGNAVPVYPSVTPDKQGALVLRAASFDDDIPAERGYSPADHDDVASGNSGGTNDAGFTVSILDSPPLSGASTGTATLSSDSGVSDSYGSSTIAINGVTGSTTIQSNVDWARFNTTTGAIDSPAPGSTGGPCAGWCNDSDYDLPEGRVGMSMVAYNGFLYAVGGSDGVNRESTIWIAKIGANGEPSLWHPTDKNKNNWVYWYTDSGLNGGTARSYHAAYAYKNKMYVLGGQTNASSGGVTTVEIADILPHGPLGSWSSGQALPDVRHGHAVQVYNNTMYLIGGNSNGTLRDTVHYNKLNNDGTMNSWIQTEGFDTARASNGGLMSTVWGAYIYLAGGCTAVNGSGYCTSIASDVQLASINSDGSLSTWNTMLDLRNKRFSYSLIAWQNNLYRFGGCSRQDSTSGDCYAAHRGVQYGVINRDGDASTVSITSPEGTSPCSGVDPFDCDLPPTGDNAGQGGQMLSASVILNGYLYVIGGCAAFTCDSGAAVSGNISYTSISSDGKLVRAPSCQYDLYGSWCVDSTNRINGTTGVAASGVAVFGGRIYVVGGLNGSGNVTNIYRNDVFKDGSLDGGWESQSFSNLGVTENLSYTFAYARANPSSAGTYPGNLYIFGGCASTSGAGCTNSDYRTEVWKCNITPGGSLEEADANDCTTSGQLQIDSDLDTAGSQGLGIHAGTVYANYIYLLGGFSQTESDKDTVIYAEFDNSNNVVAVSGSDWVESDVTMNIGRRRGTAFGYNGYLYAVGGFEATESILLDTIEFAKIDVTDGSLINDNGGKFNESAVTINQRWGLGLAVSNSYAYVIGGCDVGASPSNCTSFDETVQTFQVYNNNSGAPAEYSSSSNLFQSDRIGTGAAILNGYIYVAGGCVGSTDCSSVTANVRYATLAVDGSIGAWSNTTDSTLPFQRGFGQLEAVGGTLYYIGGQDNNPNNESADVYYGTPSTSTGDVSSWSTATNGLPAARTKHSATVWNNRIYVTGGLDSSGTATNTIYASPDLSSGGNITSAWTTTGMTTFSVARSGHVAIAYANNLYIIGGHTGSDYLSDVQFTQINTDGTLDSWSYTTSLPTPIRQADGFAANGYMYIFGGRSSDNDCTPRTLVAPISANTTIASGNNPTGIGEWYETNRRYDGGRYAAAAAYNDGKAYLLGGGCAGVVMQDDFDDDFDSSMWATTTSMSADTVCQSTSTTNTFRATTGTAVAATIDVDVSSGGTVNFKLYIPDNDTGSCLAPEAGGLLSSDEDVQLQYSTNGGSNWTALATYDVDAFDPLTRVTATIPAGAQTSSTRFRWVLLNAESGDMFALEDVFILATGSTTIAYTGNNRVVSTALLSQPQIAEYSRMIDVDSDVFPNKWLLNGLDNSIGARWQLRYRSMTDTTTVCTSPAMTTFGQETNFGDVTLGQPEDYIPKDASGNDTNCARFFFLLVTIDSSQTYGYPDDVTRGPTIADLTLFFTSDASKRLRHGKTFTGGEQQPLDTPP